MSAHFRGSILLLATLTLWRASAAGCLASTRGWMGFHGTAGLLHVVLNGCPALLPGMGPLRETRRGGAPRPPSPSGPHCGGSRSRGLVFRFSSRPDRKAAVSVPRERAAPAASPRAPQRRRRCLSGPDRSWPSSSVEAAGRVGAEGDLGPSGLVQSRTEGLGPGEAHVSKGNQKE